VLVVAGEGVRGEGADGCGSCGNPQGILWLLTGWLGDAGACLRRSELGLTLSAVCDWLRALPLICRLGPAPQTRTSRSDGRDLIGALAPP